MKLGDKPEAGALTLGDLRTRTGSADALPNLFGGGATTARAQPVFRGTGGQSGQPRPRQRERGLYNVEP